MMKTLWKNVSDASRMLHLNRQVLISVLGVQMCTLLDLKPDDIYFKWEAFSYSASTKDRVISNLDLEGARELHNFLRRQQQASQATTSVSTPNSARVKTLPKSLPRNFPGFSSSKLSSSPLATPRQSSRPAPAGESSQIVHRPKAKYTPPASLADYKCAYV